MECGQETLCYVLTWVTENELAARKINDALIKLGQDTTGTMALVVAFLQKYGSTIIGLFGGAFGAWKWWLYHERVLHKRLDEYISARDSRLRDVRLRALETIERPGPGQGLRAPSFIDDELASVLRERRWDNSALALSVNQSAEWQLSKAVENIKGKLHIAEREAVSLRQELCTAYTLRGAVASTRAGSEWHATALGHFRSALGLPGHANDIKLKELEAHQLRKLGHFNQAEAAYQRVQALADDLESERERSLTKARAKRYRAEIAAPQVPLVAYNMMTAQLQQGQHAPGAIALLELCQPLVPWELAEKGDMHYFVAFLANGLDFRIVEQSQLDLANSSYKSAEGTIGKPRWYSGKRASRLRKHISNGLARVAQAQAGGEYDTKWLP